MIMIMLNIDYMFNMMLLTSIYRYIYNIYISKYIIYLKFLRHFISDMHVYACMYEVF